MSIHVYCLGTQFVHDNRLTQLLASPGSKHRLIRCCALTLRLALLTVLLPRFFLLAVTICQPLVLTRFLEFLGDESQPNNIGYGLVAAYGLVYLGIAVSQALYWHQNARFVSMLRSFLVTAIFSKLMTLDMSTASDAAAVTLMSSDVSQSTPGVPFYTKFRSRLKLLCAQPRRSMNFGPTFSKLPSAPGC